MKREIDNSLIYKSILFGFPTRGQRRYEPKEGGKYGGAMTVQTEQYGRLKIERLPKTDWRGDRLF